MKLQECIFLPCVWLLGLKHHGQQTWPACTISEGKLNEELCGSNRNSRKAEDKASVQSQRYFVHCMRIKTRNIFIDLVSTP